MSERFIAIFDFGGRIEVMSGDDGEVIVYTSREAVNDALEGHMGRDFVQVIQL